MLKQIALEHDDIELYKLACELEKDAGDWGAIGRTLKAGVQSTGKLITDSVEKVAPKAAATLGSDLSAVGSFGTKKTLASTIKPIKRAYLSGVGGAPIR